MEHWVLHGNNESWNTTSKKNLFLMLIGTSALKTMNVLLKFPLEMHNFTSFYCKELLQKMQISVFENTFHYVDSKETTPIKASWSYTRHRRPALSTAPWTARKPKRPTRTCAFSSCPAAALPPASRICPEGTSHEVERSRCVLCATG